MIASFLRENKKFATKIDVLNEKNKLAKKQIKSAAVSSRHNMQESENALKKNLAKMRGLKRKLEAKENVIHDLSATHEACRAILNEFHQLKNR